MRTTITSGFDGIGITGVLHALLQSYCCNFVVVGGWGPPRQKGGDFKLGGGTYWTLGILSFLSPTLWFETVRFAIVVEGLSWAFTS